MTVERSDTDVKQFSDRYRRTFARTLQICNLVPQEEWGMEAGRVDEQF